MKPDVSAHVPMPESGSLSQDLLERARAMIPVLREREPVASEQGQVPDETIAEFKQAGFFKVLQPKRYGGYELPLHTYVDLSRTLAEGCMASAWVYGVVAVHNWQMALFDQRAAEEVWGRDPDVLISSSYMPVGKVKRLDGGFELSGRWAFSSGSAHCEWVMLGAIVPGLDDAPPEPYMFLVPRRDYRVVDNWDVMGLRATGSNDILVDGAFVPDHRTLRDVDVFNMDCPGLASNVSPLYRIPFAQVFNRTVSTTSLGALKRALDVFTQNMRHKRATYTGAKLAEDTTIQYAVADVQRTLRELELILEQDCRELATCAESGSWTIEHRALLGASTTSMVERCVRAIDQLMVFSGGKAIYRGNVIQNAFLDIHTARAHVANNPYPYGRNLGALGFGLPNATMDI
jgi:3-hydroxy-9,10-secoandrosta-1,3,5(10)-triene-9,17-dione monooxygenase